jgi:hypothetical protein
MAWLNRGKPDPKALNDYTSADIALNTRWKGIERACATASPRRARRQQLPISAITQAKMLRQISQQASFSLRILLIGNA